MWARIMTPCLSRRSPWNSPEPPASLPPPFPCWAKREPAATRMSARVRMVMLDPAKEERPARQILNVNRALFLLFFLQEILEEVGDAVRRLGRDLVLGPVVHAHAVLRSEEHT